MADAATAAELTAIAEGVLATARAGEDMEVALRRSTSTSVRAYDGDIEALTVADSAAVGVRIVVDGRLGFASAGSLDPDVVAEVVDEARANVPFAEPDEHVTLADPDGVEPADLDLWRDGVAAMPTDEKVAMAIELERRVRKADPRITGVRSASYGDSAGTSVVATSRGLSACSHSTSASIGVLALAREGDHTQTGAGSSTARDPHELDIATAAGDAVERATGLLGATKPASRRVTLVLEPRRAAALLTIVAGMLGGDRVLKGRTPFADRVGEAIAVPSLTMIDDPTDPASYGARPFDGEALATRVNPLIVDGVLERFLHNASSASRAGTTSTASAVRSVRTTPGVGWHALAVSPGDASFEELLATVDDGILVYSMAGLHSGVNPVSGDFSVGVEGIAIRGGERAEPVREATIASTLPRLLLGVDGVGAEVEHTPGGVSCPAMTIADVSLGGS